MTNKKTKLKSDQPGLPQWSLGGIIWGLILISVGTIALLDSTRVINFHLSTLLSLWPLLLIAGGLSILKLRQRWLIIVIAASFFVLSTAAAVMINNRLAHQSTPNLKTASIEKADNAQAAKITIKGGASKITVTSEDLDELALLELSSNFTDLRYETRNERANQYVDIDLSRSSRLSYVSDPRLENHLKATLARNIPLRLRLDSGASSLDADLSETQLESFELDSGASKAAITLGSRSKEQKINLQAGASLIVLRVPRASGVEVHIDSGLSSRSMPSLIKVDDDLYQSKNYAQAENKIHIKSSLGVSNFRLVRY